MGERQREELFRGDLERDVVVVIYVDTDHVVVLVRVAEVRACVRGDDVQVRDRAEPEEAPRRRRNLRVELDAVDANTGVKRRVRARRRPAGVAEDQHVVNGAD